MGFAGSNGLGAFSNFVPDPGYFRGPYTFTPTAVWKSGSVVIGHQLASGWFH